MGDGREGRIVAVWASVGEFLVLVWVESRGGCRIREIGGEGKERKRVVVWRNHRILVWNSAGGCDKIKKGKIVLNLQRHKKVSARIRVNPYRACSYGICRDFLYGGGYDLGTKNINLLGCNGKHKST